MFQGETFRMWTDGQEEGRKRMRAGHAELILISAVFRPVLALDLWAGAPGERKLPSRCWLSTAADLITGVGEQALFFGGQGGEAFGIDLVQDAIDLGFEVFA